MGIPLWTSLRALQAAPGVVTPASTEAPGDNVR
jgi:hypothetical protein